MPKRRGHGEGALYKRKDRSGKVIGWRGELVTGYDAEGKLIKWHCSAKKQEDVIAALNKARSDLGLGIPPITSKVTLREYWATWYANLHGPLEASTLEQYERTARLHILPTLGHLRLANLAPQQLQAFYRRAAEAGTGARTVQVCHALLHKLLADAVLYGYLGRNVAAVVPTPKAPKAKKRSLTTEEAQRFIVALRDDPLEALYIVAIFTGLRQGEILALHWHDLDWQAGTILAHASITAVKGEGLRQKDTKTEAGYRVLPLVDFVLAALKRHRVRQNGERLSAGANWEGNDLIFPNSIGRPIARQNLMRRSFKPLLRRANIPEDLDFHELRHSTASLMIALGVNPKAVQEILGHTDVRTTLAMYTHTLPGAKREALERLGALLTEGIRADSP